MTQWIHGLKENYQNNKYSDAATLQHTAPFGFLVFVTKVIKHFLFIKKNDYISL